MSESISNLPAPPLMSPRQSSFKKRDGKSKLSSGVKFNSEVEEQAIIKEVVDEKLEQSNLDASAYVNHDVYTTFASQKISTELSQEQSKDQFNINSSELSKQVEETVVEDQQKQEDEAFKTIEEGQKQEQEEGPADDEKPVKKKTKIALDLPPPKKRKKKREVYRMPTSEFLDLLDFDGMEQPINPEHPEDIEGIGRYLKGTLQQEEKMPLTKMQEELFYSIDVVSGTYFIDLGGLFTFDINFTKKNCFPLKLAAVKGSPDFVRLLLQNPHIEINKKDKYGLNSFFYAARYGHGEVMKILAERNIDIFNIDKKGYGALHIAAKFDYPNVIQMLVESDFPMDIRTNNGDTAVAVAAQKGHLECVKLLVKAGADINITNNFEIGPLYLSILNKHDETSYYLIESKAKCYLSRTDSQKDYSPIFLVIRKQYIDMLDAMCDADCDLAVKDSEGKTPLMYSATRHLNQIVNHLTMRSSGSLDEEGDDSLTILMHYLLSGDLKMSNKIIARGANIDYVNSCGKTALHLVIENYKLYKELDGVIDFLIEKGANPHIMDPAGEDCCDKAKRMGLGLSKSYFNNCNPIEKIKPKQYGRNLDNSQMSNKNSQGNKSGILTQPDKKRRGSLKSSLNNFQSKTRLSSQDKLPAFRQMTHMRESEVIIEEGGEQSYRSNQRQALNQKKNYSTKTLLVQSAKKKDSDILQQPQINQIYEQGKIIPELIKQNFEAMTQDQINEIRKVAREIQTEFQKKLDAERANWQNKFDSLAMVSQPNINSSKTMQDAKPQVTFTSEAQADQSQPKTQLINRSESLVRINQERDQMDAKKFELLRIVHEQQDKILQRLDKLPTAETLQMSATQTIRELKPLTSLENIDNQKTPTSAAMSNITQQQSKNEKPPLSKTMQPNDGSKPRFLKNNMNLNTSLEVVPEGIQWNSHKNVLTSQSSSLERQRTPQSNQQIHLNNQQSLPPLALNKDNSQLSTSSLQQQNSSPFPMRKAISQQQLLKKKTHNTASQSPSTNMNTQNDLVMQSNSVASLTPSRMYSALSSPMNVQTLSVQKKLRTNTMSKKEMIKIKKQQIQHLQELKRQQTQLLLQAKQEEISVTSMVNQNLIRDQNLRNQLRMQSPNNSAYIINSQQMVQIPLQNMQDRGRPIDITMPNPAQLANANIQFMNNVYATPQQHTPTQQFDTVSQMTDKTQLINQQNDQRINKPQFIPAQQQQQVAPPAQDQSPQLYQ